jgi:hypothetical protein
MCESKSRAYPLVTKAEDSAAALFLRLSLFEHDQLAAKYHSLKKKQETASQQLKASSLRLLLLLPQQYHRDDSTSFEGAGLIRPCSI